MSYYMVAKLVPGVAVLLLELCLSILFVNVQTEAYLLKNLSKCSWKGYIALLYSLTYFIIVVICDCWMERHFQITYN